MGYNYYNYTVHLESYHGYTLEHIKQMLQNFTISETTDSTLTLLFDGWKLWIHLAAGPDVETEAKEMAEWLGKPVLANCTSRLEIYAEDDPDEKHYNDHIYVLEAISDLDDVHIYDPVAGEFIFDHADLFNEDETGPEMELGFLDELEGDPRFANIAGALRLQPHNIDTWEHLLDMAEDMEDAELEMNCYRNLILLDPDDYALHHNLGILYRDNEDYNKAEPYFRKATELNPYFSDSWTDLAKIHFRRNEKKDGIACIEKAIEADETNELPYINAGYYLIKLEDLKLALLYSEEGIRQGEEYCCAFNKAHVHFLQGENDLAVEFYAKSLRAAESQAAFIVDFQADFRLFGKYNVTREAHDALLPLILKK